MKPADPPTPQTLQQHSHTPSFDVSYALHTQHTHLHRVLYTGYKCQKPTLLHGFTKTRIHMDPCGWGVTVKCDLQPGTLDHIGCFNICSIYSVWMKTSAFPNPCRVSFGQVSKMVSISIMKCLDPELTQLQQVGRHWYKIDIMVKTDRTEFCF